MGNKSIYRSKKANDFFYHIAVIKGVYQFALAGSMSRCIKSQYPVIFLQKCGSKQVEFMIAGRKAMQNKSRVFACRIAFAAPHPLIIQLKGEWFAIYKSKAGPAFVTNQRRTKKAVGFPATPSFMNNC